jgi:hypothetical protein
MTTFDAQVRVLVCSNCGASLPPVGPEGGSVVCPYCRHSSYVGVRDDGSIATGVPVDEAQRLASLWQQVDVGFMVHPEVTQLGEHGALTDRNVEATRLRWEQTRAIAGDPAQAPAVGDDLMWLTTLLAGYYGGQGDCAGCRPWESTLEASQAASASSAARCAARRSTTATSIRRSAGPACDPQASDLCGDSTASYVLFLAPAQGSSRASCRLADAGDLPGSSPSAAGWRRPGQRSNGPATSTGPWSSCASCGRLTDVAIIVRGCAR